MDTSKIIELLARKMAGEATTGELEQLNELISSYPDAVYYEEILKEIWDTSAGSGAEEPDINQTYLLHQLKYHHDFRTEDKKLITRCIPSENFVALAVGMMIIILICFVWWSILKKDQHHYKITIQR
jgi:transmembrane sensor